LAIYNEGDAAFQRRRFAVTSTTATMEASSVLPCILIWSSRYLLVSSRVGLCTGSFTTAGLRHSVPESIGRGRRPAQKTGARDGPAPLAAARRHLDGVRSRCTTASGHQRLSSGSELWSALLLNADLVVLHFEAG